MPHITDFFKPVKDFSNSRELDYKQTNALLEALITLSKVLNLSIYEGELIALYPMISGLNTRMAISFL